ncbi:GNAT family N-acetyltransferase [Rothia nasimurium]|uniref:GNAT family N-acetyltransferase n=1 Tax=Rothia nasimurium TaxID=85336 RepID=UPI003BA10E85
MTYTIRPATSSDATALAELAAATFPDAAPPVIPVEAVQEFIATQLTEEAFGRYLRPGAWLITVAQDSDGHLVGYSALDQQEPQPEAVPGDAIYLSKFYLRPETRGSGLAADLFTATQNLARSLGKTTLHLATHEDNLRAQKFYEKSGFTLYGTRDFQITPEIIGHDYTYYLALN